jgi:hypothetical protein
MKGNKMNRYIVLIVLFCASAILSQNLEDRCGSEPLQYGFTETLVRPTLSGPESIIESNNFVVHYTTSGDDATNYGYAYSISTAAEYSLSIITGSNAGQLGWKAPPPDDMRGGNNKYDIYIMKIFTGGGEGQIEGITIREIPDGWSNQWAASYIKISNALENEEHIKVVTAHELAHACQLAYSYVEIDNNGLWFYENCAVWIEKKVYPEIISPEISYLQFLVTTNENPIKNPKFNIDYARNKDYTYAGFLWPLFLSEWQSDDDIVRLIWERLEQNTASTIIPDIDYVLINNYNTDINSAYIEYATWRWFTGTRATAGNYFSISGLISLEATPVSIIQTYPYQSYTHQIYGNGGCNYFLFQGYPEIININFNGPGSPNVFKVNTLRDLSPDEPSESQQISLANNVGSLDIQLSDCNGVVLIPIKITPSSFSDFAFSAAQNSNKRVVRFENRYGIENLGGHLLLDNTSPVIPSGNTKILSTGNSHTVKTLNERFVSDFVKHKGWNNSTLNYLLINENFNVPVSGNPDQISDYDKIYYATIRNVIDDISFNDQLPVWFNDPWFVKDENNNQSGMGNFITPPPPSPYNPTGKYNQSTGGVFLNQSGPPLWNPPYYSVKVSQAVQDIYLPQTGRYHNFYFQGWTGKEVQFEDSTALQTGVVFKDDIQVVDPVVNAKLKGTQISNDQNAYGSGSQRKFVRTNDGVMYNLYESLNRVWLEKSTDNGSTWSIINNGNPLKNADSRNPSMCLTYYNGLIIVFETEGLIWIYQYNPTTNNAYERTSIYSCTIAPYESNPVVTYCFNGDAPATGPVVIWKSYGNDAFCGDAGLYYALINADNWSVSPEAIITNTDINSYDPSIAGNDPIHNESIWRSDPMKFNLVWEQRGSVNSSIMFYQVERLANNALDFTDFQNISAFNGYSKNYKPSIISIKDDNDNLGSRVVWLAERYQAEEERLEKGQGSENTEGAQYKTFFKDVGVSGFRSYGNKPNAPTINKLNDNSEYYLAYSEQSNLAGKVVIGSDPKTINQLETIGKDIQMGNGSNENQVIALAFHSANLPYYFNRSANMSNVTPKIKSLAIVSGREGVVGKDTAQFYFTVGDVILDDQPIEFSELPDTALINGKEILNEYLVTNPFTLNDNSVFYYSVQYGITDSASAIQALTDSVFINFTVQLLDANTDEIIGTFDNVTYNSDSVFIYNNIAYQVNVSGLNNRLVKLRLKTETNHQFDYSLTQRYAEESVLGKKFIKQINFNAGVIITEYALEQNYPNPFNPITTIRYQLPQDGMVTLKVYDILGSEVATLVNEQKTSGRYEVNFDASRLASGVYIYKLTSGSYVSSKKMLLVK